MPRLFIVATPIGNLSDISARALQTLRDCDLIAAEDTRVTRALLNHFEIDTPCVSNHQHNEENRAAPIVARMLEEDLDVALVTDAGTPCISDPGSFLAKEAAAAGIEVLAVPGPTAMASALSVSGFDTREFAFYGFLPRQKRELSEKLLQIARSGVPIGRRARVAAPRDRSGQRDLRNPAGLPHQRQLRFDQAARKDDPRHGGGSTGYAPRQRKGGEGRVLPGARSA